MFKNNKKEKFSLRKYKDGRTDSKLIGATLLVGMGLLASGGTALANVSSNGTNEPTVVSDTSKVESAKATTFTDDTDESKTFKVDAVLDGGATEPTKANINTGDTDGNDTVSFKSEATVNYKLDSDKSLLKTETVVRLQHLMIKKVLLMTQMVKTTVNQRWLKPEILLLQLLVKKIL